MKNKTWLKFLFLLICLLLLGKLIISFVIEPIVKNKIEDSINTNKNAYRIHIGNVKIYLLNSTLKITGINICINKTAVDSGNAPPKLSGTIKEISFNGVSFFKAIFKQKYIINRLSISDVQISDSSTAEVQKSSPAENQEIIFPFPVTINHAEIKNVYFSFNDLSGTKKYKTIQIENFNFFLDSLSLEKNSALNSESCSNIQCDINKVIMVTNDSFYTCMIKNIETDMASLSADSLMLSPNYPYYEFTDRKKYQADRIELIFHKVTAKNFALKEFLLNRKIEAGFVKVENLNADIFRDKRKKGSHEDKPMLQQLLHTYPHLLKIDSVLLASGNIKYTEHAVGANNPGRISFSQLESRLYNLTNNTLGSQQKMKLKTRAMLMGKSQINISIVWNLIDKQNITDCSGTLAALDMEELNPMLERNAFIYASGKIKKLTFNFTATNVLAGGKVELLYDSLKITAKNKDSDDTTSIKEEIISFIANKVILFPSNPMPGKPVREGIIDYDRIPDRFIFNYFWKSILTGIKSSILKAGKNDSSDKQKKNKKE